MISERLWPNSLAYRLIIIITLWLVASLLIIGSFLSAQFKNNSEREFRNLLQAHAYNLMGTLELTDGGTISGLPNLGDPKFLQPVSGWYWSVAAAKNPAISLISSANLSDKVFQTPSAEAVPFDDTYQRSYNWPEPNGEVSQRLEAQLFVGSNDELFQVMIAGNRQELELTQRDFRNNLALIFILFVIATILTTWILVRFALKPLSRARTALGAVRSGEAKRLPSDFPREIEPLANEINALLDANLSVIERARGQVGNLAHALKTPLAVILNETSELKENSAKLIVDQATIMQSQITTYLHRARIAAQRQNFSSRTDINSILNRLVRVMQKLNPDTTFSLTIKSPNLQFKGEEQDFEEAVGNLLENAGRFAKTQITLTCSAVSDQTGLFYIEVCDDGSKVDLDDMKQALQRGTRLDESTPGSGLGLSIVHDIVSEYGGSIDFGRSDQGGLKVILALPGINSGMDLK